MQVTVVGLGQRHSPRSIREFLDAGPAFARSGAEARYRLDGLGIDEIVDLAPLFEQPDVSKIPELFLNEFRGAARRHEHATYFVPGAGNVGDVTAGWLSEIFELQIRPGAFDLPAAAGSCRVVDALSLALAETAGPFDAGVEALDPGTTIIVTNFRGATVRRLAEARLKREAGSAGSVRTGDLLVRTATVAPSETPAFAGLARIVSILRSPDGCPWDRAQTVGSLLPQLDEELEEFRDAWASGAPADQAEELGDVLLHIVMIAQIAREGGLFTDSDVVRSITAKMVRRHPHVFGDAEIDSIEDLYEMWDEIKRREKSGI